MRSRTFIGLLCALALGLGGTGCKSKGTPPAKADPNSIRLEIVDGPEGCRLVAAVEFERVGEIPSEQVRSERDLAGDSAVLLKPQKLITGQWDLTRTVFVSGSLYLASSPNTHFLGLIVVDPQGQSRWFTEFVLKDGKIFEGGTAELVGNEADAAAVVASTLQQAGVAAPSTR